MKMSWLIARRELREILRDHNLVIPLLVLPCLMGVLTGITALTSARGPASVGATLTSAVLDQLPSTAQQRLAVQAQATTGGPGTGAGATSGVSVEQLTVGTLLKAVSLPLFWIVAVALTPAVAADSFVGEKERGTIEPLLATPIRNRELFAGKLMTAVIPAILGTWLGTAIFATFVAVSRSPYYPPFILADGDWLFSSFGIAPLVALLAAGIGALETANPSIDGHPCIDYAASSRPRGSSDPNTISFVSLAQDAVTYATQPNSHAPANLTTSQLAEIYNCQVTNWKQLGGKSGTIDAFIPQSGSGTRSFFLAAIGVTNPGSCVSTSATVGGSGLRASRFRAWWTLSRSSAWSSWFDCSAVGAGGRWSRQLPSSSARRSVNLIRRELPLRPRTKKGPPLERSGPFSLQLP